MNKNHIIIIFQNAYEIITMTKIVLKGVMDMIKGINKNVIELFELNNSYYERAFLFIKPECTSLSYKILEKEAKEILKKVGAPSTLKKKNKILYWSIRLGPAALLGH